MARVKSTNPFSDYIRVKDYDGQRLSELVVRAKGENRSLNQFAKECGVNPSTMSRLINMKNNTPCSEDLIDAIAKNADPDSGITLEELLEAYGLAAIEVMETAETPKDEKGYKVFISYSHKDADPMKMLLGNAGQGKSKALLRLMEVLEEHEPVQLEHFVQGSIMTELLRQGKTVKLSEERNIITKGKLKFKADFVVELNPEENDGFSYWAFDYHKSERRPILHKINTMFGMAYLENPAKKGYKISVLTTEPEEFEKAESYLKDIEIEDYISVILIDGNEWKVLKEFVIPRKNE